MPLSMVKAGVAAGGVIDAVGRVLGKLITNEVDRAQAEALLEQLRQQPGSLQVELNKIEAGHASLFVAGWRPFIGWVCGAALAYEFLIYPLGAWAAAVWYPDLRLPMLVNENLFELVLAMLGLAGLHSFESRRKAER